MKIIPTYVHGIVDYVSGIALLLAPSLFDFAEYGGAAVLVPRVIGVIALLQALSTDFEVGLFRLLPMRAHLINDYAAFSLLTLSPWIFRFSHLPSNAWLPHVVVGLAGLALAMCTERVPSYRPTAHPV